MAKEESKRSMKMLPSKPLIAAVYRAYPYLDYIGLISNGDLTKDEILNNLGLNPRTYCRAVSKRGTIREDVADQVACNLGTHLELLYGRNWAK